MSELIPHNVTVCDHRTSMRLERDMWHAMHEVCCRENLTMDELVSAVKLDCAARGYPKCNLSSAVRVYLLNYFRDAAVRGHAAAGHGLTVHQPLDDWSFIGLEALPDPRRGPRRGKPADQSPSVPGDNGPS